MRNINFVLGGVAILFIILVFSLQSSIAPKNEEKNLSSDGVTIVSQHLQIPWEIAFLPEGDLLVTERPGTLRKINPEGAVIPIEGVAHQGEGGLLGLALHPQFSQNRLLYLYLTTRGGSGLMNRVERYRFEAEQLIQKTLIIDNIPGGPFHDGGELIFGPDGNLYITTGDAGQERASQNRRSLAGKILRVHDNGAIPSDNPFGNAVWSYGHRNPQGLVFDDKGRLWASEHGPSGMDEINLIQKGRNYGWPVIKGDSTKIGMERPMIHSGAQQTWAPAGVVYWNNRLFFTGLRGEALYEVTITPEGQLAGLRAHLQGVYGRLRAIQLGLDGYLYISTSNTDGRGNPHEGDDKIIRLDPSSLF